MVVLSLTTPRNQVPRTSAKDFTQTFGRTTVHYTRGESGAALAGLKTVVHTSLLRPHTIFYPYPQCLVTLLPNSGSIPY